MAISGWASLTPTGAFTYTIPIVVPPGTAGMAPSLSLVYSSQAGDGLEGIGWALAGLPSINRCARTMAQDQIHGSVNYDNNDRFCMGGQRLILINGTGNGNHVYGDDGSEYRTEIESFSKIIAHRPGGYGGIGPKWFEVHTKTGQILEFGNTDDSRLEAVGTPTARAWAVDRISDTKGNYLTATYVDDQTNGQAYPVQINYTGNLGAALVPYNSVQFVYTDRADIVPTYQAGSIMQTTKLLTDIKTCTSTSTCTGATLVRDYRLGYQYATSGATRNELTSVTLYDNTLSNHLAVTTFGWQGSRDAISWTPVAETIRAPVPAGNPPTKLLPADVTGDGLTDALAAYPDVFPSQCPSPYGPTQFSALQSGGFTTGSTPSLTTYNQNGSQTTGPFCLFLNGAGFFDNQTPDFTGDGVADVARSVTAAGCVSVTAYISALDHFFTRWNGVILGCGLIGDFDGDGRTDMLNGGPNAVNPGLFHSNGDGSFTQQTFANFGEQSGDFDGDGCMDVLKYTYPNTTALYYSCNPAIANSSTNIPQLPLNDSIYSQGDFNGDGKTDIIDSAGKLFLSTGTSLVKLNDTAWPNPGLYPGDWNGDGKVDIFTVTSNALQIYLSTGTGFTHIAAADIPINSATYLGVSVIADWNNDGASDLWVETTAGDTLYASNYTPELLTSVSNGLGATTTVAYDRLNKNGSFYAKGTGASYPNQDMDGPLYVVSQLTKNNGIGGTYSTSYSYAGATSDISGRGFLGFSQITQTDTNVHSTQTTNYFTSFPFTGLVASQTTTCPAPYCNATTTQTLSQTTNCYAVHLTECTNPSLPSAIQLTDGGTIRYFVPLRQTSVANYDTDGTAFPTAKTQYAYDCDTAPCYGNPTIVSVLLSDNSSKVTTKTYDTSAGSIASWFIGRVLTSQIQSVVGTSSVIRHSSFQYDPTSGLVTQEVIEPGNCHYELDTAYGYDSFGNKTSATVSGTGCAPSYSEGIETRTRSSAYDPFSYHGAFATSTTNELGQSETWGYDGASGIPTAHTGPNGLQTQWGVDTFGRKTLEVEPNLNRSTISYQYCAGINGGTATCPSFGAYLVQVTPQNASQNQNGPIAITYYDALSRVIAKDVQGFDGSWIRTATQYDPFLRLSQTSRPYFVSGGAAKWTMNSYVNPLGYDDPLGRVWKVTFPDNSKTTYSYDALMTTMTNDLQQSTVTTKNAQGLVASILDANQKTTTYLYDAFDNLTKVTDPANKVTTYVYDARGRKTDSTDLDMGHWSYTYDVLAELKTQTDNKGQTATLAYDKLQRVIQRIEPGQNSDWVFGVTPANHDVGQLIQACERSDATLGCQNLASTDYLRTLTYDDFARPHSATIRIDGTDYLYATVYDSDGRISQVTYPSGLITDYSYVASFGYLAQLKDDTSGVPYWTANKRDAELHLTQSTAGNNIVTVQDFDPNTGLIQKIHAGNDAPNYVSLDTFNYTFDTIGNLTLRKFTHDSVNEYSCYDGLNRLTKYAIGGTSCTTGTIKKTVAYSNTGNITKKSDVCNTASCMVYGAGAGPHALTSIIGTVNGVLNPSFQYDADGNMTCELASGQTQCDASAVRYVTWTSFNMVASVTQGTASLGFAYDPEHGRIKMCKSGCGSPTATTLYLNDEISGSMSEKFVSGSTVTWRDYIVADGKIVAQRVNASGNVTLRYFLLDHLGSVAVLSNEQGQSSERDSYDAWGRRRNSDGTDLASCPSAAPPSQTTRGYINQEELDSVCVVNLNARIYDPTIGRFMSADGLIADNYGPQTLNRYSYVHNNPLSFSDPTGHEPFAPMPEPLYPLQMHGGIEVGPTIWGHRYPWDIAPDYLAHLCWDYPDQLTIFALGIAHMSGLAVGAIVLGTPNGLSATSSSPSGIKSAPGGSTSSPNDVDQGQGSNFNNDTDSTNGTGNVDDVGYAVHRDIYIRRADGTLEHRQGGTASWRTNNPGNIIIGPFAWRHGAIGYYHDVQNPSLGAAGIHDFAIFPTYQVGVAAFTSLIAGNYMDETIAGLFTHYGDSRVDNVVAYARDVSGRVGVTPETRVRDLTPEQMSRLEPAVQAHEIWREGTATAGFWNPILPPFDPRP